MTLVFDDEFLARLRSTDTAAEAEMVSAFTRPIRAKLRHHLNSWHLVDEACQETFLRVFAHFRAGNTVQPAGRLPAFVHAVAHNVAMETVRASTRHRRLPEGFDHPESASGPEEAAVTTERQALVHRVLAEMAPRDREILLRVLIEEEDRDRVCKRFGVERDALRLLLHRAKLRFRALLDSGETPRSAAHAQRGGNVLLLSFIFLGVRHWITGKQ